MLESALALAARGWAVFPVKPGVKTPDTKNGFKDATTDSEKIRIWWTRNPNFNVAVATGPASGFWAYDVDPKDGGHLSHAALEAEHGALPLTLRQNTARTTNGVRGQHYLFRWVEGLKVRNRGKFAPGLDVRGDGGYILVPPSIFTGHGDYAWVDPDAEILEAPEWLLDRVIKHAVQSPDAKPTGAPPKRGQGKASAYGEKALDAECRVVAECPPGSQDDTLIRRATRIGSLVGGGEIEESYAFASLVAAGLAMVCGDASDPWTRAVVEDKVRRGMEHGKADPNSAPPREPRPGQSPRNPDAKPQLRVVGGTAKPKAEPPPALPDDVDPQTGEVFDTEWMRGWPWIWKDEVNLKPSALVNISLMIEHHPALRGMFEYNSFADSMTIRRGLPGDKRTDYPRDLTDHDETALASWLNTRGLTASIAVVAAVVREVASRNAVDPLRQYLDGLKWDGKPRIGVWLTYYAGVPRSEYSEFVGRLWMIGAVARAMVPGAKVDTMLILEGRQGLKKSSLLRALAGAVFFSDQIGDITNKDSSQLIQGRWVIEVPEMDKFSRHESNAVKDYLARQEDRYRPSYGRNVVTRPRRCIFAGTINPNGRGYIRDVTGARRFWPVDCTAIDLDAIRLDRDQLWAEAVQLWRSGEKWWVEDEELEIVQGEQEGRIDDDVWEPRVYQWLQDEAMKGVDPEFTSSEVLSGLGVEVRFQNQGAKVRIAEILHSMGCKQKPGRKSGRKWCLGTFGK